MRKNRHSRLWEYLETSGVLVNGKDSDIKAAKRAYRKKYLLEYKRKARAEKPEYTIRFSKHNGELSKLIQASKKHGMLPSAFIHRSTLAYIEQKFLVPDIGIIVHLEQLLSDCLNEIKSITKVKEKYIWHRDEKIERIEKRISKLENDISTVLRNPLLIKT